MKKFAINTTSNLLSALVIAGAIFVAQPAKAGDDFVKGLFGVLILNEILNNNSSNHTHSTTIIDRQVYNDHARSIHSRSETIRRASQRTVCYSEYREATNGTIVRYDYNCQGNVLSVSR